MTSANATQCLTAHEAEKQFYKIGNCVPNRNRAFRHRVNAAPWRNNLDVLCLFDDCWNIHYWRLPLCMHVIIVIMIIIIIIIITTFSRTAATLAPSNMKIQKYLPFKANASIFLSIKSKFLWRAISWEVTVPIK